MGYFKRTLVASITVAVLAVPSAGFAHPRHKRIRLPRDYAAWSRVAVCESGGWQVLGYAYPDSLGVTRANFLAFGGRPQPPGRTTLAERVAQIKVADRLVRAYRVPIPDQMGCAGSW